MYTSNLCKKNSISSINVELRGHYIEYNHNLKSLFMLIYNLDPCVASLCTVMKNIFD